MQRFKTTVVPTFFRTFAAGYHSRYWNIEFTGSPTKDLAIFCQTLVFSMHASKVVSITMQPTDS
jgi:hypothetical protein